MQFAVESASGSNDKVDFTAYQHNGKTYLIAANYTSEMVTTTFNLNLLKNNEAAKEVFTGRSLKLDSGILKDTLNKYETRVYEIK